MEPGLSREEEVSRHLLSPEWVVSVSGTSQSMLEEIESSSILTDWKHWKLICFCASLVAQMVKNLPAMQETWIWSLGWEDPLEKETAVCMLSHFSLVWLSATLWTVARQALRSMGFSRQEYWNGCHSLLQGIFPTQGSNPGLLHCRQILYHLSHQGSPPVVINIFLN